MGCDCPTLMWFRSDLRVADNPALAAAIDHGHPVVPLFVLDEETPGAHAPGGAARWWLHQSLRALADALDRLGAPLVLRRGPAETVVPAVAAAVGAGAVHWNRLYEPWANDRDARIKADLRARGVHAESHNGRLLAEPWGIKTGADAPYKVFTPYWKAFRARPEPEAPLPAPERVPGGVTADSETLDAWGLTPTAPDWAHGLRAAWTPGEAGAHARLNAFLETSLAGYPELRNRPDTAGTSRLSPHLHWGEVSPRQVWAATRARMAAEPGVESAGWDFLRELVWREFSYHLLYWWPEIPETTWKSQFRAFPWRDDADAYAAWTAGRTGYPVVDAGMRELWATGWMHNRVRMIVGSFLVKDLLLPWQWGERWFWDTLVDADLANNSASWQWVAGCGADAAPYFRIFNPVTQGQKFDPEGGYVRTWVPELARMPAKHIHAPWQAPPQVLTGAGVRLGETYPHPVVDHSAARKRALAAFETIKGG
ncbi:deoxyribodipyrimidine photo-lyase [Limimonas halophila]|uniref:Deoxyribodipyrimidine photo-lyase n=1 Tax=Limimonas halophila TaxID=1082479 RepID=A0A1G7KZT4_9PROT|nr:deoxyribodipyrimidine photo-lyase [Limimonas halophila]SDF42748.1 deoxyribodipyrimidine photo-lyase [Limimonas halophila]